MSDISTSKAVAALANLKSNIKIIRIQMPDQLEPTARIAESIRLLGLLSLSRSNATTSSVCILSTI